MKKYLTAMAALLLLAAPAGAADNVKIGFITTLSGPAGIIGKHMKDASELSLSMLGGKLGGVPAQIIYGDDQQKPDIGRQVADEMLTRDKVDFLSGIIWSNVMLAIYQPAIQSGGMGIQFVKQYAQAGVREKIPLSAAFTVDETTWPAIGDAADGNYEVGFWSPDLDNPRNEEFVGAFRQKYNYWPSFYAAQSFDAIAMIDRAVAAVKGDLADKKGMIAALEKADFPSVRGKFKYNTNHFPIENLYLLRIAKYHDGTFVRRIQKTVFADHADAHAGECKMQH